MFGQSWKISSTCLTRLQTAPNRAGLSLAGLVVLAAASAGPAAANPQGANVVAGTATVTAPVANTVEIQQQSDKAVINWDSFDIDGGETTIYTMPSASSVNLSRVVGSDLSEINGNLQSNGRLYLINPQGIVFGEGASVNVGSLVATTADISNENFLNGNLTFDQASTVPGAGVINNGQISIADAGLGALVAPEVENNGLIQANLGQVVLGGAETFALDLAGDGLISFAVGNAVTAAPTDGGAVVENSGTIRANGGRVLLTAEVAAGVVDNAINMNGLVEARTFSVDSTGAITLDGGENGLVQVSGTLDASGSGLGESGGDVKVSGELVQLEEGAEIDASGSGGGGTVLVGGDVHGGGDMPTARRTVVQQGARIAADATEMGDGGTVVVWGDEAAALNGAVSARGGAQSGNGGLVEVSSNGSVGIATGTVDVTAPNGEGGSWLIDPEFITIAASIDPPAVSDTEVFFKDPPDALVINPAAIEAAVAGTTVIFQANQDISVDDPFKSNADLVMQAGNSISINDTITMGLDADLHLEAFSPHAPTPDPKGSISFAFPDIDTDGGGGQIIMDGGKLTMIAPDFTGRDLASAIDAAESPASTINVSFGRPFGVGITVGGVESDLTAAEVLGLTADAEQLNIGKATTAGTDGLGTDAQDIVVASIDVDADLSFADGSKLAFITSGAFTSAFDITPGLKFAFAPGDPNDPDLLIDAGSVKITATSTEGTPDFTEIKATGDVEINASGDIEVTAEGREDADAEVLITSTQGSTTLDGTSIKLTARNSDDDTSSSDDVTSDSADAVVGVYSDAVTTLMAEETIAISAEGDGFVNIGIRDTPDGVTLPASDSTILNAKNINLDSGDANLDSKIIDFDPVISIDSELNTTLQGDETINITNTGDGQVFVVSTEGSSALSAANISISAGNTTGDNAFVGIGSKNEVNLDATQAISITADGKLRVEIGAFRIVGQETPVLSDTTNLSAENITITATDCCASVDVFATESINVTAGKAILLSAADGADVNIDSSADLRMLAGTDISLREIDSSSTDEAPEGDVDLFTFGELTLQADGDIFSQATLATEGGDMFLEADSPAVAGGGDGTGSLTLGTGANVDTTASEGSDGNLTLIAADFDLGDASFISAGEGNLLIAPSTPIELSVGGAGSTLDDTELALLDGDDDIPSEGQWSLGAALTAPGENGEQKLASAGSISLGGDLTLPNIDALLLYADEGIAGNGFDVLTADLSLRAGDTVTLTGDVDRLEASAAGADVVFQDSDGLIVGDVPLALGLLQDKVSGATGDRLAFQAAGDLTVLADIGATGPVFLEADSPDVGASDGEGTLTFGDGESGISLVTAGSMTWIGAGFDIADTSEVSAGAGGVFIAPSTNAPLTIGGPAPGLAASGLANISTPGVVTIGSAVSAGDNGLGAGAEQLLDSAIDFAGSVTLAGAGAVLLDAAGSIISGTFSISTNKLAARAGGDVDLTGNAAGSEELGLAVSAPGQTVTLNSSSDLAIGTVAGITGITAKDLTLDTSGSLSGGPIGVTTLLVRGTSADLFGTINGVSGPLAAFFGVAEPVPESEGPFLFNQCPIGRECLIIHLPPPGPIDIGGPVPPQMAKPSVVLPDLLVTKQLFVPDLEGRFSNSGNEEIW